MKKFVVCITGASGVIYGYRVLEELSRKSHVEAVVSSSGETVLKEELGIGMGELTEKFPKVRFHSEKDFTSPLASGSFLSSFGGVLVVPCSTSTLGAVASGVNFTLIHRVCEVALKERVKLIMLVREMPYSRVHLENMIKLTEAGAIIMPASPAFYHRPKTLEDAVNFVIGKIFDSLGVEHDLYNRWKGGEE
jgi:4-hydroxy-3-polyprenylbenzoate decarboxylase